MLCDHGETSGLSPHRLMNRQLRACCRHGWRCPAPGCSPRPRALTQTGLSVEASSGLFGSLHDHTPSQSSACITLSIHLFPKSFPSSLAASEIITSCGPALPHDTQSDRCLVVQELDLERQREVMRQWTEELAELAEGPLKARSDI